MLDYRFWVVFPLGIFEEQAPGCDASGNPILRVTDEFLGPYQDGNEAIEAVEGLSYGSQAVVAQCDASEGILPHIALSAAFSAVRAEPASLEIRVLHHFVVQGKELPSAKALDQLYETTTVAEEKKRRVEGSMTPVKHKAKFSARK